ncbi:MAG: hypothetical protein K2J71_08940 [Oscillospiraceae bacterium]|nr:hypothetical protein [Oscillospiraceae bacterium]
MGRVKTERKKFRNKIFKAFYQQCFGRIRTGILCRIPDGSAISGRLYAIMIKIKVN